MSAAQEWWKHEWYQVFKMSPDPINPRLLNPKSGQVVSNPMLWEDAVKERERLIEAGAERSLLIYEKVWAPAN